MTRRNRIILILMLGVLVSGLVFAVALSGKTDDGQDIGAWDRIGWACDGLLRKLGLAPGPRCTCSTTNACKANLKQIDGAKATWALENKKTVTDIPTATELYGTNAYIRDEPKCPQGGKYVIGSVERKPCCSIPGHTVP